jgi:hypothetical protein
MMLATLIWLMLPFFVGFSIYLLPQADRFFSRRGHPGIDGLRPGPVLAGCALRVAFAR